MAVAVLAVVTARVYRMAHVFVRRHGEVQDVVVLVPGFWDSKGQRFAADMGLAPIRLYVNATRFGEVLHVT